LYTNILGADCNTAAAADDDSQAPLLVKYTLRGLDTRRRFAQRGSKSLATCRCPCEYCQELRAQSERHRLRLQTRAEALDVADLARELGASDV
jgi:hypothetical protein